MLCQYEGGGACPQCVSRCFPLVYVIFTRKEWKPNGPHCLSVTCAQVITKEVDGAKCEPYEEAVVEVPETYTGSVVELFAQRKGEMVDMQPSIEVSRGRLERGAVQLVPICLSQGCFGKVVQPGT